MKNYKEMSKFEINRRVALYAEKSPSAEHECIDSGACYLITDVHDVRVKFDPCNNPSDAWPIITENFISIEMHGYGSSKRVYGYCDKGLVEVMAKNLDDILRAAMICFLKMKDAQNDHGD